MDSSIQQESTSGKISKIFASANSDITMRSSDGVLFKVHLKNLEMHSEGFPGGDPLMTHNDSVVDLSETSTVLELLFQYMYRQRQPDLSNESFETLSMLAEAAEKYQVFSAMEICKVYMEYV